MSTNGTRGAQKRQRILTYVRSHPEELRPFEGRIPGPCDESLLNELLKEMDGLREDAAVLFVLTTNRPEHLEAALASRPGRIDQAIGFPLPDDHGRRQLIRLYAGGLTVEDEMAEVVVKKTKNASAAFIKELMRRSAQFCLENAGHAALERHALDASLEEMLFTGGSLNAKLLGVLRGDA